LNKKLTEEIKMANKHNERRSCLPEMKEEIRTAMRFSIYQSNKDKQADGQHWWVQGNVQAVGDSVN
jgi:hypothetical protein